MTKANGLRQIRGGSRCPYDSLPTREKVSGIPRGGSDTRLISRNRRLIRDFNVMPPSLRAHPVFQEPARFSGRTSVILGQIEFAGLSVRRMGLALQYANQ